MSSTRLDDLGASVDDLAGAAPTREVVLAVERTADATAACEFLRDNVLKGEVRIVVRVRVGWGRGFGAGRGGAVSREPFAHARRAPPTWHTSGSHHHPTHTHTQSDILHILHIAKIVPTRESISHGPPGTSVSFRDEPLPAVKAHVDDVRAWLASSIAPLAESTGAQTRLHLFVESTAATAADVAAVIGRVADDTDASLVAIAKSNKTRLDKLFVGSVAGEVQKLAKRNVLLVVAPK